MRVAVFDKPGVPLHIETRPTPEPGPGEVLIKVERCGVCGSDLHWTEPHERTVASGTVMGHEFAGEVVDTGAGVHSLTRGDRVCVVPFAGCGSCRPCMSGDPFWCPQKRSTWGGFGEYTVVSASGCVKLPEDLSAADGALVEPLACGLHAVSLAQSVAKANVLVTGAGPIGLSCIYWLRRSQAGSIAVSARTARRRDLALSMGATSFFLSGGEALEGASEALTQPPDIVFECTGAPGMIQRAMQIVRPRGTVIVAGLCMKPDAIAPAIGVVKQLRLQFVGAYSVDDFRATVAALASGDLAPREMITSIVTLAELPRAFEALRRGGDQCKLMVDPWAQ